MIELIVGITAGIVLDGAITITAIQLLKRWNKETLDKAIVAFESSIDTKTTDIITQVMIGVNVKDKV